MGVSFDTNVLILCWILSFPQFLITQNGFKLFLYVSNILALSPTPQ